MIDFIQENLAIILGGSGVGAVLGGIVGMMMTRSANALRLNEATVSEIRSMVGSLDRIRDEFSLTRDGFAGIVSLLTPGADSSPFFDASAPTTTPADPAPSLDAGKSVQSGMDLAEKLLSAVMAIPALPKIPDFTRDFEMLRENPALAPVLDTVFSQLKGLDSDSINTMIGEFKTLVESSLKPGLERARNEGIDFVLEPETLESLTKGAGAFVKSIGGMSGILETVTSALNDVLGGIER